MRQAIILNLFSFAVVYLLFSIASMNFNIFEWGVRQIATTILLSGVVVVISYTIYLLFKSQK